MEKMRSAAWVHGRLLHLERDTKRGRQDSLLVMEWSRRQVALSGSCIIQASLVV